MIPQEILPVLQITLPLLGGMWLASHAQNKRFDDLNRRIDEILVELREIRKTLGEHAERLTRLEERIGSSKVMKN
jgi:hypothetical protein